MTNTLLTLYHRRFSSTYNHINTLISLLLPFDTDIDECVISDDLCAMNATCTNTVGSYNCSCDTGFFGNGTTCCEFCSSLVTASLNT